MLPTAAAWPDAWPGDDYTGPLTPISGHLGAVLEPILSEGSYPTAGSEWRYKTDFTETTLAQFIADHGSLWKAEDFDDAAWLAGPSQIGYGDSPRDEVTRVPRTDYLPGGTVQSGPVGLFRRRFTLTNLASIAAVTGVVRFDDACAVYVNGTQIYRHSDLTPNAPLTEYTETTTAQTRENVEAPVSVPLSLLHEGANTIAVEVHQHDPGSGDLSFDMQLSATRASTPNIRWTAAGGPYHLTGDATVPAGVTLVMEPGTRVFADGTRRLTVNGILQVLGTAAEPVMFSHRPGAPLVDDPREPGTQAVPPKWGGVLVQDSLSPDNVIRYATFYGAQPTAVEGSITVVRAACLVDHCYFTATYLHGVYGKNCSITVQDCIFPDVFPPGKEALGEELDNLSEFVEVDSPANDPAVLNNPAYLDGFPVGGHLRLYRNQFHGSSGHNDLVDITAGKWGVTPVLDVQDNHFHGPTGDEHLDLNGDAYIAGNIFENCTKDGYTSDHGYANAISSDAGKPDTTVVVVRNVFTHCDHAVNVKRGCGIIFEHNTVADVNADYHFERLEGDPPDQELFEQEVACSALNFFIPEDAGRPGDGAFLAWNVLHGRAGGGALPRMLSWADLDQQTQPPFTTKLEMLRNVVDPGITDLMIGAQHPDNVLAAVWQPLVADPLFVNRAARDYALGAASPARGAGPFGRDAGASIEPGVYLGNVPTGSTHLTSASVVVGGPGIFACRWRLNAGPWSDPVSISPGVFPRTGPTVRTVTLDLQNLSHGSQTLEVIGQDFAGNWQAIPTSATWVVSPSQPPAEYPAWLAWHGVTEGSDTDHDGLPTLTEFAFGTAPDSPGPPPGTAQSAFGSLTMVISLPETAALPQGHGRAGISYRVEVNSTLDADGWTAIASKTPTAPWTGTVGIGPAAGGFVPVTIQVPEAAGVRRFLRVQAVWNP
ncbi:MAG: hypothetical protein KA004_00820 [Verrucomicrobiales bacterium]|nr:hypothetical protein [Verrucomicrobiales bacterium]